MWITFSILATRFLDLLNLVMGNYRDLRIYQLARKLSVKIYSLTRVFPEEEKYSLTNQFNRSTQSIVANIAEGYGRRVYLQEYIRFLIIAQASCDESREHLKTAYQRGYLTTEEFNTQEDNFDHLGRMLTLFIRRLKNEKTS